MSGAGYLLLRRDGGLFGVASAAVLGLSRRGADYRVEIADGSGAGGGGLLADEVLGVEKLDVRPLGRLVRRYWPEAAGGWAIHAGAPVVVVDPLRPPLVCSAKQLEGEIPDGE
jgi:hypothetical protein